MISKDEALAVVVLAGAGLAAYLIYKAMQKTAALTQSASNAAGAVASAAGAVVDSVNPASDQNLAYRGATAFGEWATGDVNYSLAEIYEGVQDWFTPDPEPIVSGGGGNFTGSGATGSW